MAFSKSWISRVFLLSEVLIFCSVYFFGVDGRPKVYKLCAENSKLEQEIAVLNKDICAIENEKLIWNADPFYKEKVAREQLQMARKDDEIFFIQ
jgi:cell division protein FtsB